MTDVVLLIELLKKVKESPTLGESSNAVVVSGKLWQEICAALDYRKRVR